MKRKKISTYLIHGSLGSGKTTFLRRLLENEVFKNSIVLENEYANLNIDKDLLASCEVKIVDVSGGCICCTSGTEFLEALDQISNEKEIDNLFIETTGVASSVSLIKQLMLSSTFDDKFALVKNILIVDALEDDPDSLETEKLLDLLMADLIILNKSDLGDAKINEFHKLFNKLKVEYIPAHFGKVKIEKIVAKKESKSLQVLKDHIDDILDQNVDHSKEILYQVVYPKKQISRAKMTEIIKKLNTNGTGVLRVKGTFTDEHGQKYSINATPNNFEFTKVLQDSQDALVLIGKNLTKDKIKPIIQYL